MTIASFLLALRPCGPVQLPPWTGDQAHALFLNLVGQKDSRLASMLHADAQNKPFTVSALRPPPRRRSDDHNALPEPLYRMRFTTLSEDVFNVLSQVLYDQMMRRATVQLGKAEFRLIDVATESVRNGERANITSAEELWERAQPVSDITLRFTTPTAFRTATPSHEKKVTMLFPNPTNVFHSYREKWNAFTPNKIDDGFKDWVEENVVVEAHHLQTERVPFGNSPLSGFRGWCRYTARDGDLQRLKQWNALADFAYFCGTGQKTTQGMGQTRRIHDRRTQPNPEAREGK